MSDLFPADEFLSPEEPLPPHSIEAEEAVLGAVFINPEAYNTVAQFLKGEDFFIERNRWVWETFVVLHQNNSPIDFLTVTQELERRNRLSEAGGQAYLMSLVNQTPSSINIEAYGKIIEAHSVRRRMITAAKELVNLAHNQQQSVDTIIDEAEKAIFSISEQRLHSDTKPIKQVLDEYVQTIGDASQNRDGVFGVPTGYHDLDQLLGGMQKSDFLIIAGRPSMGKTGFMLSVARNAAQRHKKHVAIFSLEMSNEQVAQRLISQETGFDTKAIRGGAFRSEDEWGRFFSAIAVLEKNVVFLDDTPGITPVQLRAKCRRLHLEYHLDLVIVDYIQLMSGGQRIENRVQEVSFISRNLKALARDLKVPVLAAAQLSRDIDKRTDKRPLLSDLRESGSLEQDADVVMFINRPYVLERDHPHHNLAEIIVAKHRNGPTGDIQMVFREDLARFEDAAAPRQTQPRRND